jgi:hypothetical protein
MSVSRGTFNKTAKASNARLTLDTTTANFPLCVLKQYIEINRGSWDMYTVVDILTNLLPSIFLAMMQRHTRVKRYSYGM